MAEPQILIVDVESDVRSEITKVADQLSASGFNVVRPASSKELTTKIGLSSLSLDDRPDLVVHFSLGDPTPWDGILESFEMVGVRVSNPFGAARRLISRVGMCSFLDSLRISQPDWYYGSPNGIPAEFGDTVVEKSVDGHLVHVVDRRRIHAAAKVGFYQRLIENPSGDIKTVYWVFGRCFSMVKPDTMNIKAGALIEKRLTDNTDPRHEEIVRKIQRVSGLDFFCVDFINGHVIDVNFCPNPFRHPQAVDWLVAGFTSIIQEQSALRRSVTASNVIQQSVVGIPGQACFVNP